MGMTTVTLEAHIPEELHPAFQQHIEAFAKANPGLCVFDTDEKGRMIGTFPDELCSPYLQHIRDFDTAHPVCHFKIVMKSPDISLEAIDAMYDAIDPPLKHRYTIPLAAAADTRKKH
jgi:hypothetical protein